MYIFYMVPPRGNSLMLMILVVIIPLLISIFLGVNFYMLKNVKFEIDKNELKIKGGLYRKVIKIDEIDMDSVTLVDISKNNEYYPVIKKNGIGLPGIKEGWFKLKNGEKSLLFLTNSKNVVYIQTTRGFSLLLSVNKPEQFIAKLKSM